MEGAWLGKYDTLWEVLYDSIKKRMKIRGVEGESFVFRYLWFLPFLPNDLWFIHIFFLEIHDSLFYVSDSTTE